MQSARATNRIVNPLNHIVDGVVRKIHMTSGQIVKRLMNADKPKKQMSEGRAPRDTASNNPFQFDKNLLTAKQLNEYFDMKEIKKEVINKRRLSSQQEITSGERRGVTTHSVKMKKKRDLRT